MGALSRAAAGVVAAGGVLREEIWERLARVPDPRSPRGRVYPLPCLLVVWLCALTGQVEVDQKSNETSAFQPLLRARLARLPWADVPTNLAPCAPR